MEQIPLAAARREGTKKGAASQLRRSGRVPAVIYGAGHQAENLSVAIADLEKVLRQVTGENAFLSLKVQDETPRMAVLKELQGDHLGKNILHVDFYEVRADQKLVLDVPVEIQGEAKGVNLGGVLNVATYTLSLEGLAKDIPDTIVIDISDLQINESIHSQDLKLPAGVSLASEENIVVVSCTPPAAEVKEAAEGEEEAEAQDTQAGAAGQE